MLITKDTGFIFSFMDCSNISAEGHIDDIQQR
jgi:hypothetical protein